MPIIRRPRDPEPDDGDQELVVLRCPVAGCLHSESAWADTKIRALAKAEVQLELHYLANHAE